MASSSSSQPPSSSSNQHPPDWRYDVFLSFRGEDTRLNFTSHLHSALAQKGVQAYIDDKYCEAGSPIEDTLLKAIENSMISIVVFSKDYGSSPWCLDELVKINECMITKRQIVLPIFYDVDPSDVAGQTGIYSRAFEKHERFHNEKVKKWRDALKSVGELSGWDARNSNQSEVIKKIVDRIWLDWNKTFSMVDKNLVGMDSHINQMKIFLSEDKDVRFIGIWGMSGIGKTTIAKDAYAKMLWKFDACCFLESVKEKFNKDDGKGLLKDILFKLTRRKEEVCDIQSGVREVHRCMKNKKILLVIDDVDDLTQLKLLAGETNWFGPGSRVIITCENEHLLSVHEVNRRYQVRSLTKDEACMLLSRRAFNQEQPPETFRRMTELFLDYADGHPLALSVLGAFLYGRSEIEWKDAIKMLDEIWENKVINVLRISVNGLGEKQKKIFLDIACCLSGCQKEWVIWLFDACDLPANLGVQLLIEKSLLTESEGTLQMHGLIRLTGRVIVERESPNPAERSRLWDLNDIAPILEEDAGATSTTEMICAEHRCLDSSDVCEFDCWCWYWYLNSFRTMRNLRFLRLKNVRVLGEPVHLSSELRYLEWDKYQGSYLPISYNPSRLLHLHLWGSELKGLWYSTPTFKPMKIFRCLRALDLRFSIRLEDTPDFRCMPNLVELNLHGCTLLSSLHPSFQTLKQLVHLDMGNCENLIEFATGDIHEMQKLQALYLDGCKKLQGNFLNIQGAMPNLKFLDLRETKIENLSISDSMIENLPGLVSLNLENCEKVSTLPLSLFHLKELNEIKVFGWWEFRELLAGEHGGPWRIDRLFVPEYDGKPVLLRTTVVRCN